MTSNKSKINAVILFITLTLLASSTAVRTRSCSSDKTDQTYFGSLTQEDNQIVGAAVDFYSLNVTEGQVLKINFSRTDSSRLSCFQLYIYLPDDQPISANGQYGAECSVAVSFSGHLYLAATTFCHSGATGDYFLDIDGTAEQLVGISASDFIRAIHPNKRWTVQTNRMTWGSDPPPDTGQKISSWDFNPGYLEYLVFFLINGERKNRNLPVLDYHYTLNCAARQHSEEMAQMNYFSHTSPVAEHKTAKKRIMQVFHYSGKKFCENIGKLRKVSTTAEWDFSYQSIADEIVKIWLTSADDRHNILRKDMDYLGMGCACVVDGDIVQFYFTGNFGDM
jgi:uncharacterized protein YkwD